MPWASISEFLRILRVTSPQLIVFIGREEIRWVLASLPFVRGLLLYSIQWEWGNVRCTYKLLVVLDILIHLSQRGQTYFRLNSFIWRILPSFHFSLVRYDIWSFGDVYQHLVWWIRGFGYLGSGTHQSCKTWWKCILSTLHLQK